MALNKLVILVGGVGGAKLAHGLAQLYDENLTVIVNTGDDFEYYGLHVSPDLDTLMYTLSGHVNRANGWGLEDDTRMMLEMLRTYGEDGWFGVGDRDIATHLLRTQALRQGERLTTITQGLTKRLGISQTILPMTDQPVRTMIDTETHGALEFQEYFVKHRWQPVVQSIQYRGIEEATISPEVQYAIETADAILVGPSNPWLSIEPILAIPRMRDLIKSRSVPRVALSPIVDGKAIKGPAAKIMGELGYEISSRTVADYYGEVINGYVYDVRDQGEKPFVNALITFDTIMNTEQDRIVLAENILRWIESRQFT